MNYIQLVKNIRHNGLEEFIIPVNMAIGNISEDARLYHWNQYPEGEAGSSGHQLNSTIDYAGHEFKTNWNAEHYVNVFWMIFVMFLILFLQL